VILPASYLNGFAPRDGQPLYPSLWRGCVGAWNPGLGPSGLTLRDWSGFANHGVLSGQSWEQTSGVQSIRFSTNGRILGAAKYFETKATWSAWIKVTTYALDTASRRIMAQDYPGGNNETHLAISSAGKILFYTYTGGYKFIATGATTIPLNTLIHVAGSYDGTTARVYLNGVEDGTASQTAIIDSISNSFAIGGIAYSSSIGRFDGWIAGVAIHQGVSADKIKLLATRPGIAYEMAPRRRSSVQVTTNRRRRIIIGGNR